MEKPVWLDESAQAWLLRIRLQPGARRSGVVGEHGDRLKIAVRAPAVDGKANEALLHWLGEQLDVPRTTVTLVSGQTSRDKRVAVQKIDGLTQTTVCTALAS
ncbi:DUF167 domain-containing protein [Orrella marina]|uniref:UPF0235 protein DBV39_19100 n=1 Tax=Orrella marina TaxID=2163011 RepID=A0A2R4XNW8_9BURK|nr:DUF167 domain-containing protein [Orrella marina]AWB35502.1 YggU family protein [Orrella marina]